MSLTFGPFVLDRKDRRLNGPEGPVELSARAFDILAVLLDRKGEVVSKDALFAAVWPGVVVEENTLQVHISALRKALGPNLIATVHGRGYRYAGPEPRDADEAAPLPSPNAVPGPVLAILPFANPGDDPDQQYFSEGIAQDIADRLTRFRGLTVIGLDRLTLGAQLRPELDQLHGSIGADFAVTGSVRRAQNRIRISVRLTETATRASIWAEQYDRPLADLFELQDEVSEQVAATIARRLEVELTSRSLRRPPSSLKAHDLTLRAIWHYFCYTRDHMAQSIACSEQALTEDPDYREAMLWLGNARAAGYEFDFDLAAMQQGLALIEKAIRLDPSDSRAFVSLSIYGGVAKGPDASRAAADHALRLNPGDYYAHAQRALVSIFDGDHARARQWLESGSRLTPNPLPWVAIYQYLIGFHEGRFHEVCTGLSPFADQAWQMMYVIAAHGHLGEGDKAKAIVARFKAEGRLHDFFAAAEREPYLHPEPRDRLVAGLKLALG
ncbi:MAG: winged helix-turn-helix domain-containing protein [Tabrizicola sp.]|nr:winged helix-turn-helix domain-containing protein [Tabrizicola sp.]